MNDGTSRRDFLRAGGGTLGAAWLAAHWPALSAAAEHAHEASTGTIDHSFKVFSPAQARDVEAIAAQIVPSGATPGAREAGVVYFIDHVLAGVFAAGAKDFIGALDGFRADFAKAHPGGGSFADLDGPQQIAWLKGIETTPFFGGMRFFTVLGLLSLPSYGGNENKVGWKLVGFVDRHVWQPPFGYYDAGYEGWVPYGPERQS